MSGGEPARAHGAVTRAAGRCPRRSGKNAVSKPIKGRKEHTP